MVNAEEKNTGDSFNWFWLWLLAIVAAGAAVRLFRIGLDELWFDEALSAVISRDSMSEIWAGVRSPKSGPLYFMLLKLWTGLLGNSEIVLRLFSMICGTSLIALAGHAGNKLISKRAGLGAAVVAAISSVAIFYSQETRGYSLLALESMAVLYFTGLLLQGESSKRWAGLTVSSIAMLYTHPSGAFLMPVIAVAILFMPVKMKLVKMSLFTVAVAGAGAIFWLSPARGSSIELAGWVAATWNQRAPGEVVLRSLSIFGAGGKMEPLLFKLWHSGGLLEKIVNVISPTIFLALAAVGTMTKSRSGKRRNRFTIFLAAALLCPLVLMYALSEIWQPVYLVGRADFFVAPAFFLLVGAGMARIKKDMLTICLFAVFIFTAHDMYFYMSREPLHGKKDMIKTVEEFSAPDTPVICTGLLCEPFEYYMQRNDLPMPLVRYPDRKTAIETAYDPAFMMTDKESLERTAAEIIASINSAEYPPDNVLIAADSTRFNDVNTILFVAMAEDYRIADTKDFQGGMKLFILDRKSH